MAGDIDFDLIISNERLSPFLIWLPSPHFETKREFKVRRYTMATSALFKFVLT